MKKRVSVSFSEEDLGLIVASLDDYLTIVNNTADESAIGEENAVKLERLVNRLFKRKMRLTQRAVGRRESFRQNMLSNADRSAAQQVESKPSRRR